MKRAWDWLINLFERKGARSLSLNEVVGELAVEVFVKELAIQTCINLIANTISRGTFRTFEKGVEVRKENHYLLNYEPNPNKSASKFWRDVVHSLVYENEALVVQAQDRFYVADSFDVQKFAFRPYIYSNVVVDGFTLSRVYEEPQVWHFELHHQPIKALVDGLYRSYGKLIAAGQQHFLRNSARRGLLKVPATYPQTDKAQQDLEDLLGRRFKRFMEAEGGAVLPLTGGMEYQEAQSSIGVRGGGGEGREIRALIDDVFDMVAMAFQVPPQLLKGHVADTENAFNNFLTFCVNPLAELITDEINRKLYGRKWVLERSYVKLDTSAIRAVDIKDVANALDVLVRIGAYSIDNCLEYLGMEPLGTDWSTQRWMTKNYEPVEAAAEGGEADA